MGKVSLNINGRAYGLGCEAGEEERLERLGRKLDARVGQMAAQFGQIGDLRLLVMAGITLLDEMEEPGAAMPEPDAALLAEKTNIERELETTRTRLRASEEAERTSEVEAAESLMAAAERIERLAERLSETR